MPHIGFVTSREFRDWLNRFSEATGLPAAALFDQSVRAYAKRHKFEPPPKPRVAHRRPPKPTPKPEAKADDQAEGTGDE